MRTSTRYGATKGRMLALGALLAALVASLMLAAKPSHASTTFTVDSTADYGDAAPGDGKCDIGTIMLIGERCTLRAAIQEANKTSGADTIDFAIPAGQEPVITPATQLPTITGPVTINGYSQPGAQPNTKTVGTDAVLKVVLSGASAQYGNGLLIGGSNSTVKGLVINRWPQHGIRIDGPDATGNKITGNYIGTDATGTKDLGNLNNGVGITLGSNNIVGGTTAGARNVISGNKNDGVLIFGSNATGDKVIGNYVGTDASGTKDLGNLNNGVGIDGAPNNAIGGAMDGERNVISANAYQGVKIENPNATGNKVMGNYIGTDKYGAAALGNSADGVFVIHSPNNAIGGGTVAGRNVISANAGSGVSVFGDDATGDRLLQNSIFANGGLGMDLGDDGLTANDPGDADTGPNDLQNKPVINSARTGSLKTTIKGSLNSTPNKTFAVRFFSNPSGTDEGKTFIGQESVTTDGSGNVTFSFVPAQKVGSGRRVTATATGPGGNTSEFSAPRTVVST
jgi:CSLREA domain-containing protein